MHQVHSSTSVTQDSHWVLVFDHKMKVIFNHNCLEVRIGNNTSTNDTNSPKGLMEKIGKSHPLYKLVSGHLHNKRTWKICRRTSVTLSGEQYYARVIPVQQTSARTRWHAIAVVENLPTAIGRRLNVKRAGKIFDLTKRELVIVKEILECSTNKEISNILSLSEYTVKDHIKKIMRKIGVNTRPMIILSLLENKCISHVFEGLTSVSEKVKSLQPYKK